MAILPVNANVSAIKLNKPVAFKGDNDSEQQSKSAAIAKSAITTAGIAGIALLGYKRNWGGRAIKWLSETGLMKKKVFPNYEMDNAKFMSMIGVSSIVLKDGLGCYLYVKQSLNNKKIPEDKRKFVAALDLANGGLMIAMQLLMFFTISNKKFQDKMFNKFFGKHFTRSANKALKAKLQKIDKLKDLSGRQFHYAREADKKGLKNAFSYLTSLAAATLFAKRVIVPFIATPLADKTKAWMCRNDKPVETHKDTKNTYDTNKVAVNDTKDATKFEGATTKAQTTTAQAQAPHSSNLLDAAKQKA